MDRRPTVIDVARRTREEEATEGTTAAEDEAKADRRKEGAMGGGMMGAARTKREGRGEAGAGRGEARRVR